MRNFLILSLLLLTTPLRAADPQVPGGFTIQKVAGHPLLHRPIFASFDDTGRLFVGESNGENLNRDQMLAKKPHWISCLEDTDCDGVFDKSTKFVEDITLPQGCLWYRGSLYAACPPSIWKFTDTDGDGKADQREEILTGFGFSGNACDTHGPFLSPTGRFYIVQGRHGHEFKDKNGVVYSKGKAGRIYSCRPDGSDVRVHAGGGFDNPVEVDFTEEGECIGTVNILYRDRGDCLMHWVEGGVYPREDLADAIAEFKWTGGLLGPIHNLGHVACSGIMRYRGVHFGDDFKNKWFFTEFNTHKVRYAELKRSGSTFTADVHEFLHCDDGDFHPTDVLEDADGSLLVLNTGAWFLNGCPTSRVAKPEIYGGIYRVKKIGGKQIADPRGKLIRFAGIEAGKAIKLLDNDRHALREAAIETLSTLDSPTLTAAAPPLSKLILDQSLSEEVRRNLVWVLGRRDDTQAILDVRSKASWDDPISRMLTYAIGFASLEKISLDRLRTLQGTNGIGNGPIFLRVMDENRISWLTDIESAGRVMRHAKENPANTLFEDARNDILLRDSTLELLELVTALPYLPIEQDHILEHNIVYALIRGGHPEVVKQVLNGLSPETPWATRIALIALDQMDDSPLTREMVLPLLSSEDARLQQTALEVIARHPGWGAETLALLRTWVQEPELSADRAQALRGFLLAQTGDMAVQGFIAEVLGDRETASDVRGLMWEVMQRSTVAQWPEAWNPLLVEALRSQNDAITLAALQIINQRSLPGLEQPLLQLIANEQRSLKVRADAVAALSQPTQPFADHVLQMLLGTLQNTESSRDDVVAAARAIGAAHWSAAQLQQLAASLSEPQLSVSLPLIVKTFGSSSDAAVGAALVTNLLQAPGVDNLSPDELAGLLRKYPEAVRSQAKPLFEKLGVDPVAQAARLAELSPLLEGGDARLGRGVFFGKKAACSSCHAVAGEGGRIGPHLTTIGTSRSPQDLLEAIVYPSASFVNGYRPYTVVTDEGKVIQGIISAESPEAITLRTQDLQEVRVRRDAIDEMSEASVSIMPKGLDTQLTPEELRHLLAFLRERKSAPAR